MSENIRPLESDSLEVQRSTLFTPTLEVLATALKDGLNSNFKDVEVNVVTCPDLRNEPFDLASEGLGGKPRLLDIGGVPYLVPLAQKTKLYEMKDIPKMTDFAKYDDCLIIGAGAAPWTHLKRNAEMMPNLLLKGDGSIVQKTHIARTHDEDNRYELLALPETETKLSLLGNLFLSNGAKGPVLEVRCKGRSGPENFVSQMRKTLADAFPSKSVGLGGIFCVQKGQVKIHVMPEYSEKPLKSDADVENWLKFYKMDAPYTCLSFLVSRDPGLDLRIEHTHGLNKDKGQGGHYHCDTSAETVEYHGYFSLAEYVYRVDRPKTTHQIGRD